MDSEEKRLRKKNSLDPVLCPVCGITIRPNELANHYQKEIENLNKIKNKKNNSPVMSSSTSSNGKSKAGENSSVTNKSDNIDDCWGTYQKIKENRNARLKIKNRKRKIDEQVCPVCNKKTYEDISIHVENCLKRQEDSEDDDIDVCEGDSYEWAGQTRIRASSLLNGGYSGAGIGTSISSRPQDEDDTTELNVDGDDDTQMYGPSQYSERDVLLVNREEQQTYLRKLVVGEPSTSASSRMETDCDINLAREENDQNIANSIPLDFQKIDIEIEKLTNSANSMDSSSIHDVDDSATQIIASLKAKIREYENFIKNKPKCLICLDNLVNPCCSICCWHVHCEKCWMYTLGSKKLCPQCNMITSPADLRRIYL